MNMKKFLLNLIILVAVLFCLFYSFGSFAANFLTGQVLKPENRCIEGAPEEILSLSAKINPLDPEPYYQEARVLYERGLKEKNMPYFRKSLELLVKSQKLNICNVAVDILILEVQNLLGNSPIQTFENLNALNKKYPNHYQIQKMLIEQGLLTWKQIDSSDKEVLEKMIRGLLIDKYYWKYYRLIDRLVDATKDSELIKRIIPMRKKMLLYLKSIIPKYPIRFDYLWLNRAISNTSKIGEFNASVTGKRKDMAFIKEQWFLKFGKASSLVTNDKFIGWYKSDKEISKGRIWANGTIYGIVLINPGSKSIVIKAKSTKVYDIPAYMMVCFNNEIRGGVYIENDAFQEYVFPIEAEMEQEILIGISFENDFFDKNSKKDRNLYISTVEAR